ncbi:MAG TPA: molybdopterin biosynthesis protein, partial [Nitrospirota bacterium]|nr:molybdopterin biosynthesis protein [Nitrospirota bacterium]
MAKRRIYIQATPLEDALNIWRDRLGSLGLWSPLPGETVHVDESLSRTTAGAVSARLSSPFFHSAAMDGIAVRFADTVGASETN